MQKSASPASVALRLNNLEQKFDELENPEPPEPDRTLVDKLARMTIVGAELPGSLNPDWTKNAYWFEDGVSIAQSLYGLGNFSSAYQHTKAAPFYSRVFGNSELWGRPATSMSDATVSLSFSIYGAVGLFDAHFAAVTRTDESLCHRVFGTVEDLEWLGEQTAFSPSFFSKVFTDASIAQTYFEHIDRGDTLIEIIKSQHDDIESLKADVASLSARLAAIGA
ncbi:hypothetical protein O206_00025 [Ochrobactrum sp. EGD-AQ16]|nr:hypothetical protein O206_00025 [Ochrobactrum sp. EGD-AQ16]